MSLLFSVSSSLVCHFIGMYIIRLMDICYISSFFLLFFNDFIYLFLAVLGLRCHMGFSLDVESGDCSPAVVHGLSAVTFFLLPSQGSARVGFAVRGAWAQ